jgi:hypothetical protein
MPQTKRPKPEEHSTEKSQYMYRGRNIVVEKGSERTKTRLFIDDLEIEIEQTEDGVHSHAFMFQVFGTPFELAEELVKQWGDAKPERVTKPPDHPHH